MTIPIVTVGMTDQMSQYNWIELTHDSYGVTGIPKTAIIGSVFATSGGVSVLLGVIAGLLLPKSWRTQMQPLLAELASHA